jgi:type II restriction enzyme
MKTLAVYKQLGLSSSKDVFNHLVSTLKKSNTTWDYFVNWAKVFGGIKSIEVDLNILNYLIGKDNFDDEMKFLLGKHPSIVKVIPILLACRENSFEVLTDFTQGKLNFESFTFSDKNSLNEADIEKVIIFMKSSGLASLFTGKKIKNVIDYVTGIEVGLDSNGRKNRGGTTMEGIIEVFLNSLCKKNNYRCLKEATAGKIKDVFGIDVPVDKSSRRYDFVMHNGQTLYLIETNFYGGGGSKLKATAGEYKALQDYLRKSGHPFIWITDGLGWKTTLRPLEEAFNHIDFVLNLAFLENGVLEHIIKENIK